MPRRTVRCAPQGISGRHYLELVGLLDAM
jgi:hypothetical protein